MSPVFQLNPPHVCKSRDDLLRVCPQPAGTQLLNVRENQRLFGDVVQPDFESTNIVTAKLPGFGKGRSGQGTARIHRLVADSLLQAFNAIQALGLTYYFKPFGPASTYCVRYAKTDENRTALESEYDYYKKIENPEKVSWNVLYAQHDQKHGRLGEKLGKATKLDHLSKHTWGSAFDLNPSENPLGVGKGFDLPFEVVKVLGKFGFYWGGYFKGKGADYMHFQWGRNEVPTGNAVSAAHVPSSHVVFPFGEPGKHESPIKYFFLNEHHGRGGYFPLGLYQNLHGGIHLNPMLAADSGTVEDSDLPEDISAAMASEEGAPAASASAPAGAKSKGPLPVRAGLPGYIVAARLVDPKLYESNKHLRDSLEDQPLGFVLVRHELKEVKPPAANPSGGSADESAPKEPAPPPPSPTSPFYSLYMHLDAPKWDAQTDVDKQADKAFEAAPWLEKFLRMEHGGVVVLDPTSTDDFGKTFWASAAFDDPGASPVPVRGREHPVARVAGEAGDRIVGVGKAAPKAIKQAIERFKAGAVVTFDRPVLPVAAGEVIGFLRSGGQARRYLHWEIFGQPGQGLTKLRELAQKLDIKLDDPLQELCEDNFLEMPSIHDKGAPNEIDSFFKKKDPVLNDVIKKAPYAKKLQAAFQEGKEFVAGGTTPFHYNTTIKLANPYHFQPEKDADGKVAVTYLADGKPIDKPSDAVVSFGETITLELDVPAAADMVRLQSPLFRLELTPPPPVPGSKPDKNAADKQRDSQRKARRELWKAATGRRWRDLAVEHINEWSAANLTKYIETKVKAAYFDSTEEKDRKKLCEVLQEALAPLCWYAPAKAEDKPHGEQTLLADGSRQESLFGADGALLPKDGHIEDMHPATALWLLDLMLEEDKVALRDAWPPDNLIADPADQKPIFFDVIGQPAMSLGATVVLAVVLPGYESSSGCDATGVCFVATPEGEAKHPLALASYVDGAAVAKVPFPFWGKTEVQAFAQKKGSPVRDSDALKPTRPSKGTTITVPPPEIVKSSFTLVRPTGAKPGDRTWSGSLLAKNACPSVLEGYLAFTYWKADAGRQPDFSMPGTPGGCLWPVVAERFSDEEHMRDGLKMKGDFIVGVAKRGASPRTVRVSADFVLQDFMDKKVAEASGSDFKVALPLVQRLQVLRDACKAKKKGEGAVVFSIFKVAGDGLSVLLMPSRQSSIAELEDRASQLAASDLFSLRRTADSSHLVLSYAPSDTTATLTFTTDLGPALQALANSASLGSGEQLFARPTFIAPNGGHHVFSKLDASPEVAEDQVVMATAAELRKASAGDPIEVETDVILPPVHAFGFGPLTFSMGRSSVRTTVELRGPAREWGHAKFSITCKVDGDQISGGVRERDHVSECWYLEKWNYDRRKNPIFPPKHRWKKKLEFTVEATNTKGIANPPAPLTGSFDATPKLISVEAKLDGDKVVITGQAHAMPTSADLAVLCQRQDLAGHWVDATSVMNTLSYRRNSVQGPNSWGAVDEDGAFRAEADSEAFGLGSYRFTWYVGNFSSHESQCDENMVIKTPYHFDIDPVRSPIYSGAELGGTAKLSTDDDASASGTVNEGLHGEAEE
jgi:hypothetical protein